MWSGGLATPAYVADQTSEYVEGSLTPGSTLTYKLRSYINCDGSNKVYSEDSADLTVYLGSQISHFPGT